MQDRELLANYLELLKENGFQVYVYAKDEKPTYAFIVKGINIGYVQCGYYGGLTFSTVNKPAKNVGTGFGLNGDTKAVFVPTIEHAIETFISYPAWGRSNEICNVVKYSGWDEYISKEKILKYIPY